MILEWLVNVAHHRPVRCSDELAIAPVGPIYDLLDACPSPVATLACAGSTLNQPSTSDAGAFALLKVMKTGVNLDAPLEVHFDEAANGTT